MKQIGAGPFRFGPDSDEVLNNIQPKSDAERHFIQWLKNECPPNCRMCIRTITFLKKIYPILFYRFGIYKC